MKARYSGICRRCGMSYPEGTDISNVRPHGWVHTRCPESKDDAQAQADKVVAAKRAAKTAASTVDNGMFTVPHPYDAQFVATVKSIQGRRWNGEAKVWSVPVEMFPQAVEAMARFSKAYAERMRDGEQFAAAREAFAEVQGRIDASRAADADLDIPAPDGLDYLPYQRAGIGFALGNDAVLIGDEMGLGKTIQALGVINADESARRVLVICPASLRLNWKREAEKWLVRDFDFTVVEGRKATIPALSERHVVIVNYDVLKAHHDVLHSTEWDVLVVDEAHYLKNPKAQRTSEVFGRWNKDAAKALPALDAKRRIFLTGTPIPNRPIELWALVRSLDSQSLGRSWKGFARRYCDAHETRYGWDTSGASNLDELQQRMRATFLVRRLKADVLKELPAKRRQLIVLPPNGAAKHVRAEQKAIAAREETEIRLQVAAALAKAADDDEAYEAAVAELRDALRVAFEEMAALRRETAVAKIPHVVEHVRNVVSSAGQVVVFAHHKDVVKGIREKLEAGSKTDEPLTCVQITGDTPMKDRDTAVQAFQAGQAQVFIGNIQAAGVGLTLTASSHVVFAELDWVPGNVTQAEDRCHRIGQTASVTVQHIVLEGSIDETMARTLIEKQAVQDAALDTRHDGVDVDAAIENGADDIEESFSVSECRVTREAAERREQRAAEQARKSAAREAKRAEVIRVARELSPANSQAVHEALRQVAAACDGARERDGWGFNKIDTAVGKALAAQPELSPREAALGQMIVRKYRRQVDEATYAVAMRRDGASDAA